MLNQMAAALLKFFGVVMIALLGGLAYAVTTNVMIKSGILQTGSVEAAFGFQMTHKAVMIWVGCVLLSLLSLKINHWSRLILWLSPVYAPSGFAVLYVLMNTSA